MLKMLDNSFMLQAPLTYAIAQIGENYLVAVKMNAAVPAPHFVKIDWSSRIQKREGGLLDFRSCTAGDLIDVSSLRPLENTQEISLSDGVPTWNDGDLRPGALVVKAIEAEALQRRKQLGFVSYARGFGKGPKRVFLGKFFDPMTQKEIELPGKSATPLKFGDPVLVTYAVVPAGMWRQHV